MNLLRRIALRLTKLIFLAAALFAATHPAMATKRQAFVVGISAYKAVTPLRNPANDAKHVAEALKRLGFSVRIGVNLSHKEFSAQLKLFSKDLEGATAGVFFYAGHGIQVDGRNYMLPADADPRSEADIPLQLVPLDRVMQELDSHRITSVVVLDACRDNPIGQKLAGGRGLGIALVNRIHLATSGLAKIKTGTETVIAYSTQPGATASDGRGDNSPFAAAWLKHVETPSLDIAILMRRVRGEVIALTKGRQVPWDHSSLTQSFVFADKPDPPRVALKSPAIKTEDDEKRPPRAVTKDDDKDAWQHIVPPFESASMKGKAPVHDCDRIAASKTDPEKVVPGKSFIEFDGAAGVQACRAALKAYPNTTRFQFQLARSLHKTKAYLEAAALYKPLVERGYLAALTNYALQLFEGQGVERNEKEATRIYRIAAHRGDLFSVYTMAVAFDTGRGVPFDPVLAAHWMRADLMLGHDYALQKMSRDSAAWTVAFRKALQRLLKSEGVYGGPINGAFGPDTINAMRKIYGRHAALTQGKYLDTVPKPR